MDFCTSSFDRLYFSRCISSNTRNLFRNNSNSTLRLENKRNRDDEKKLCKHVICWFLCFTLCFAVKCNVVSAHCQCKEGNMLIEKKKKQTFSWNVKFLSKRLTIEEKQTKRTDLFANKNWDLFSYFQKFDNVWIFGFVGQINACNIIRVGDFWVSSVIQKYFDAVDMTTADRIM